MRAFKKIFEGDDPHDRMIQDLQELCASGFSYNENEGRHDEPRWCPPRSNSVS